MEIKRLLTVFALRPHPPTRSPIERGCKILFLSLFTLFFFFSSAQTPGYDGDYARKMLDTLASPWLLGRGYVKHADEQAADIIATEFHKNNVPPFEKLNYYQLYDFSVNTFPHTVDAWVDGKQLNPGEDFIVFPESPTFMGEGKVVVCDSNTINNPKKLNKFLSKSYAGKFVLFSVKGVKDANVKKDVRAKFLSNAMGAKGIIEVADKLTWSVSTEVGSFPGITIITSALKKYPKKIKLDIQNKYLAAYQGRNVVGVVKGTGQPDSFMVFSSHYDHLGIMGHDAIFTGANDNASGCAMMLTLAKYYAKNPPKYSMVFIGFGGEELGLLGSFHFVNNPAVPLSKIKFLVNLDILGTGDEGITVVNGSVFQDKFDTLVAINKRLNLLKEVKVRGKAANSDHYPFTERGVPAFFIYTMGGIKAYHDVQDRRETLPLTEFPKLFTLLTEFVKTF